MKKTPLKRKKSLNKTRKTSLSSAKRKAWKAFSLYIRKKDMNDKGEVECYTCGKRVFYKKANAGHGIGGRNNAVLFLEEVVKPQCVGCNIWGHGQYRIFTRKLIDELGVEEYDTVSRLANEVVKYTISDYQEIEKKYKEK